jgi:hypothetical protein
MNIDAYPLLVPRISPAEAKRLGVRWTLGDVSDRGFEVLRLSIWGAYRIFGPQAAYAVCYNTISEPYAKAKTGPLPPGVVWHDATQEVPPFLREHVDEGMAEGVGWKLAPLRFFPDLYELSLDNDCVLWDAPKAVLDWLQTDNETCVAAADVVPAFGQFAPLCPNEGRNGGIRGLSPGFDFGAVMQEILREYPVRMTSELDEQGLQTAALCRRRPALVVGLDEVTICSPFYPHLPHLGTCGAHFVGLNVRHIPWNYYDRPADEWEAEFWDAHKPELYRRTGTPQS